MVGADLDDALTGWGGGGGGTCLKVFAVGCERGGSRVCVGAMLLVGR